MNIKQVIVTSVGALIIIILFVSHGNQTQTNSTFIKAPSWTASDYWQEKGDYNLAIQAQKRNQIQIDNNSNMAIIIVVILTLIGIILLRGKKVNKNSSESGYDLKKKISMLDKLKEDGILTELEYKEKREALVNKELSERYTRK